jgi:hypothetical protein
MKIWLDDIRDAPDETWIVARNAEKFKELLEAHWRDIQEISFDHDIASFDIFGEEITGYHCLCWVEKIWYNDCTFVVPKMSVHSANPPGRDKMRKVIEMMYGS